MHCRFVCLPTFINAPRHTRVPHFISSKSRQTHIFTTFDIFVWFHIRPTLSLTIFGLPSAHLIILKLNRRIMLRHQNTPQTTTATIFLMPNFLFLLLSLTQTHAERHTPHTSLLCAHFCRNSCHFCCCYFSSTLFLPSAPPKTTLNDSIGLNVTFVFHLFKLIKSGQMCVFNNSTIYNTNYTVNLIRAKKNNVK